MVALLTADGLAAALEKIRSRRARGKVVFSMEEENPAVVTVSHQLS